MTEIVQRIRIILIDDFAVDPDSIKGDSTMAIDLNLDSMELTELALELEQAFNIEIPDSAITAGMTFLEVCDAVNKLIEAR